MATRQSDDNGGNMYAGVGFRPVPDPTILTTQQLNQAVLGLKELILSRLDSMDRAVSLLQEITNKSPSIAEVVAGFTQKFETMDVKIGGVNTKIEERDVIVDKTARETKVAVDAALSAQEKQAGAMSKTITDAIDKSERQVTKEVDSLKAALDQIHNSLDEKITAATKTLDDKINDNKSRIQAMESKNIAYSSGFGFIATGIGIVAAVIGAIIAIFFKTGGQ